MQFFKPEYADPKAPEQKFNITTHVHVNDTVHTNIDMKGLSIPLGRRFSYIFKDTFDLFTGLKAKGEIDYKHINAEVHVHPSIISLYVYINDTKQDNRALYANHTGHNKGTTNTKVAIVLMTYESVTAFYAPYEDFSLFANFMDFYAYVKAVTAME